MALNDPGRCHFPECGLPVRGALLGLCNGHRLQVQRGKSLAPLKSQITPFERFLEKVQVAPDTECWEWMGHRNRDGYGIFQLRPLTDKAHRASFYFARGYLPTKGWTVDHICRNRSCVNPAHLQSVTHSENTQNRGLNSNNTSGFPGVQWRSWVTGGKWKAVVGHRGKAHVVGYYSRYEDAVRASQDFREKNHPNWRGLH